MKKVVIPLLFAVLILSSLFSIPCSASRLPETIIRVGVLVGVKSFGLNCAGGYTLYDAGSGGRSSGRV